MSHELKTAISPPQALGGLPFSSLTLENRAKWLLPFSDGLVEVNRCFLELTSMVPDYS